MREHHCHSGFQILLFTTIIIMLSAPLYGQHRPGEEDWEDRFGHPGIFGLVHAVAADDQGNVYIGGEFSHVNDGTGYIPVRNIVRWDGQNYHPLGGGIQGRVYALEVDNEGNLYAGGFFSRAWQNEEVSINAHNMAMWDGTWWYPMGHPDHNKNGPNQSVSDILVMDDTVYVAGTFSSVRRPDGSTMEVNHIAGWHNGDWFPLQTGTDRPVKTLAGKDGILYAGGNFQRAGDATAGSIARWDGRNWSPLPVDAGTNAVVNAMAFGHDGDLYVGGLFMMIGGIFTPNVARFDGQQWHPLDQGIGFIGPTINAIAVDENFVYFGGSLIGEIYGFQANQIVRWDGSRWYGMLEGMESGTLGLASIQDLTVSGGQLYAAGYFGVAGEVAASNVARWDGFFWHPLGDGSQMGLGNYALAVGATEHGIYVGGAFKHAGTARISYIARWDGSAWRQVGRGLSNSVETITVHEGKVYAGGEFRFAGDLEVNRIAMWDGMNWHGFGRGLNGKVNAIAVGDDGMIYAGGEFTQATNADGSTVSVNFIAMWDGNSWHSPGNGMNNRVLALEAAGDQIYAGGLFQQAGGETVNFIARWDGNKWHSTGGGTNSTVTSLASNGNGTIFAGGAFSAAGNKAVSYIAAWDGEQWHDMHGGLDGLVFALTWKQGSLYAGGMLSQGEIARWQNGRWIRLPGRLEMGDAPGLVHALAVQENNIYIGGYFISAAGLPSNHFASWADRSAERFEMLMFSKAPGAGMAVETGSTFRVEWTHAPAVENVRLEIRHGDIHSGWEVLVDSIPAETGHYTIQFGDSILENVSLWIADRNHPEIHDTSGTFSVYTPERMSRHLRVAHGDGSYDIFRRPIHAWHFSNSRDHIWPYDKRFPEWDLYCRAMGNHHCYNLLGVPRRWALTIWGIMKIFGWQGSCSGFTTTSLMYFNDYFSVTASFPGYHHLYDVPVDDQIREMLNINQLRFLKPVAGDLLLQRLKVWNDKPVTTLEKIEASLDNHMDHLGLLVMHPGWALEEILKVHTVLPIKVKRSEDGYKATIYLYENQTPSEVKELEVDLQHNRWTYSRFGVEDAVNGLFVSPPLSRFIALEELLKKPAQLQEGDLLADASPGQPLNSRTTETTGSGQPPTHMTIVASPGSGLLIENMQGGQIGINADGGFTHTLDQSMPIMPMNPETEAKQPLGYFVPVDNYRISMHHSAQEASQLSMIGDNRIYTFRNLAPELEDREIIRFQNGLSVINPDAADKKMELEILTREPELERQYLMQKMDLSMNDSIHVTLGEDLSIQILNMGKEKSYDLRVIQLPQDDRALQMDLPGLTINPNSRLLLQTGRDLFLHDSIKILIDTNLDGIFNDSLRVIGVISTSGEADRQEERQLPQEYGLMQNYPNPFNASTTIAFELPEAASVRLELFTILGQHVATLEQGVFEAGRHTVMLDGSHLSSGMYVYRLQAGSFNKSRKLLLVK